MSETKYPRRVSSKWRLTIMYEELAHAKIIKDFRSYRSTKKYLVKLIQENERSFISDIKIRKTR